MPYTGDHGPDTAAAKAGTVVEPVEGQEHNRTGRRRRLSAIDAMTLTMRQEQAAKAIEQAWCRLEMCSSGGELKEQVDASPKPDAAIAQQVNAQSRWQWVSKAIPRQDKVIVLWVCTLNKPVTQIGRALGLPRAPARFKAAMDKVADHLQY